MKTPTKSALVEKLAAKKLEAMRPIDPGFTLSNARAYVRFRYSTLRELGYMAKLEGIISPEQYERIVKKDQTSRSKRAWRNSWR